jgi:hypothetical protein
LAAFLTVAIVVLGILHYLLQISVLDKLQQALSAIFLLQMLVMIWVHINQSTEITLELIMAAACAYILLGMSWAYGYFFLELASPESFKISDKLDDDLWNYYYYSFVTLTTVGYGDIVAVSKSARALTILEAIIGQLYLAIMISRLVGLHTAQLRPGQE